MQRIKPFNNLTLSQVHSFNEFIYVLRRLGVIGKLHSTVTSSNGNHLYAFKEHIQYNIAYDGYTEDKSEIKIELELEKVFGKLSNRF